MWQMKANITMDTLSKEWLMVIMRKITKRHIIIHSEQDSQPVIFKPKSAYAATVRISLLQHYSAAGRKKRHTATVKHLKDQR